MEFAIPISRFDPTHVRLGQPRSGPFRKTIPFGYNENNIQLNSLILILQPLRIVEIDWIKNQVVLEESKKLPFLSKLEQFQSLITTEVESQKSQSFHDCKLPSGIQVSVQPWLKSKRLTLYLSAQPETLPFYTETGKITFSEKTIKPGDILRAVVKIQGISLQMSEDDIWTGKSRIQHHILQLYKISS